MKLHQKVAYNENFIMVTKSIVNINISCYMYGKPLHKTRAFLPQHLGRNS